MNETYPLHSVLIIHPESALRREAMETINREPDLYVRAHASSTEQAIPLMQEGGADVVVVDLPPDDTGAAELVHLLRSSDRPFRMIVLTTQQRAGDCEMMLNLGADGFLTGQEVGDGLVAAIRAVLEGNMYFGCFQPAEPSHWFG